MESVGQIEKRMQASEVGLFRDRLGHDYLGSRIDRDDRNIESDLLRNGLSGGGMDTALCDCVIHALEKVAGDTS